LTRGDGQQGLLVGAVVRIHVVPGAGAEGQHTVASLLTQDWAQQ